MSDFIEFITIFIIVAIVAVGLFWYLERCPHQWELIEKGNIQKKRSFDPNDEYKKTGYYEIHRCHCCKKLKRTEI